MKCSELQTRISPEMLILKFSGEIPCLWWNQNIPCSLQLTSSCFQSHKFSLQHHTQQQRWNCFCARHEGIQGSRVTLPCILNLSTKWRWYVKFMPQCVGSRNDLDVWEKRKIFDPARNWTVLGSTPVAFIPAMFCCYLHILQYETWQQLKYTHSGKGWYILSHIMYLHNSASYSN